MICVPQSQDPICAKFDKFLAHGQAHDNDNDNGNMFITIDLHIYKIQDARYQYSENKHQALFFLW